MSAVPAQVVPLKRPAPLTVPEPLRDLRGWLVWKFEADPKRGKPRKVPYYVSGERRHGGNGGERDRAQLSTFADALRAREHGDFDGVGLAMLPEFGLVALDFDACVQAGAVHPEVASLVAPTYAELSPSGTGVRAFMQGELPNKKSRALADRFGFETFHNSGFVTITGRTLDVCRMFGTEDVVAPLTPAVRELFAARFAGADQREPEQDGFARDIARRSITSETLEELEGALLHGLSRERAEAYDDWINIGQGLKFVARAGFEAQAFDLWLRFSARSDRFEQEEALAKWNSFAPGRITHRSIFTWAQEDGWANPRSAAALKTGAPTDYALLEDRTDTGNANMLVRVTSGDLRYVPERQLWLWWDGGRWIADQFGAAAYSAAQRVAQHYHGKSEDLKRQAGAEGLAENEAKHLAGAAASLEKWAGHCRNKRAIDAMLALASKDPRIAVAAADLDCDPWLLGVANGVVDLRTGQLRDAARDEFVTKRSPVAFVAGAKAPRWRRFIEEVTGAPVGASFDAAGDVEPASVGQFTARPQLAGYLQRALGYTLTGSTAEQKMFIAIGSGSNGKNVLLDMVQELSGDYCRTIAPEALMATRHDADAERPSPTTASLAGARLAISSESRDGQRLDVALVKRHTGGGFMTARLMRENTFRFAITHKLVLMTNHRPALDHMDEAMRGRLHMIPFDRRWNRPGHPERDPALPDGDKDLMARLRGEAEGILAWLVEGAAMYARDGLEPPPEVVRMTRAFFAEQDPLGRWLEQLERCAPEAGMGARDAFNTFRQWHRDVDSGDGRAPETEKAFAEALRSRSVAKKATKHGARYGIRLKAVVGGG